MPSAPALDKASAPATAVALALRGIGRTFPTGVVAVEDFDLDVPAGQFLALLGPSGCGKSTLLRLIAGLDVPDAGRFDPPPPTTGLAYVFQDAHLLPWRTVLGNVALPLELAGVTDEQRQQRARDAIAQVGLTDALDRYPAQLSGGMRMRASLARALVTEPKLLLLDEPFAALDEITRQQLDEQLRRLWHQRAMTVIFVTHSIGEAAFLAQRAIVLSPRPARIVLDHEVALPDQRSMELRSSPAFAAQTGVLFAALQRGSQ